MFLKIFVLLLICIELCKSCETGQTKQGCLIRNQVKRRTSVKPTTHACITGRAYKSPNNPDTNAGVRVPATLAYDAVKHVQ
ncbi:hypothetical protein NQ315_004325 [Exocentrus adspersus]|uniref:Secreted protein n=1 Tax=Exocentrus adspersus TaxID=1586481 RepID=A0AAV8W6Y0_9CUCU|nr:hypothetical protein NQ315_004325 [Exocentrus adspersus]